MANGHQNSIGEWEVIIHRGTYVEELFAYDLRQLSVFSSCGQCNEMLRTTLVADVTYINIK